MSHKENVWGFRIVRRHNNRRLAVTQIPFHVYLRVIFVVAFDKIDLAHELFWTVRCRTAANEILSKLKDRMSGGRSGHRKNKRRSKTGPERPVLYVAIMQHESGLLAGNTKLIIRPLVRDIFVS
jgi:hypothetical protein